MFLRRRSPILFPSPSPWIKCGSMNLSPNVRTRFWQAVICSFYALSPRKSHLSLSTGKISIMAKTPSELHPLSIPRPLTGPLDSLFLDMSSFNSSTASATFSEDFDVPMASATPFEESPALNLFLNSPYGGNDR